MVPTLEDHMKEQEQRRMIGVTIHGSRVRPPAVFPRVIGLYKGQ